MSDERELRMPRGRTLWDVLVWSVVSAMALTGAMMLVVRLI